MENSWQEVKLSDVCDIISGGTPKTSVMEYWNGDIPWLSVKDFNGNERYVYNSEKKITESGLANSSANLLHKGDVIISARGTVGELATIPFNMAFNQSCYGLRAKEDIIDKNFLYYVLKNNIRKIKNNTHGSVFDTITRNTFDEISISLPPVGVQRKIAGVLGALDDKIELNNKINQNLELQAQALFKSWFVDFEPFGGKMPDDWKIGKLEDIADVIMGQSPSGNSYNEKGRGCIFFQGRAEFGFRFPTIKLFTTEPRRMARQNDILMSVRAPVGDVNVAHEDCCIGRGLCAIRSKDNFQSFILYTLWSVQNKLNIFNGEGTVFGSINKDSLNNLEIIVPNSNTIQKFENLCSPMDNLIRKNYEENTRLSALRDTLLPKLMSGEINVDNVDISELPSADKSSFTED